MASREDVQTFQVATAALIAKATELLLAFFASLDRSRPDAPKLVADFYVTLTQEFGRTAATLAADYYDELRSQSSARGSFDPILADPITSDHAVAVANNATAIPAKEKKPTPADDLSTAEPTAQPLTVASPDPKSEPRPQAARSRVTVTDTTPQPATPRSRVTVSDEGSGTARSASSNVQVTDAGKNPARSSRSRVTVNDASPQRLSQDAQRLIMQPARNTIIRSTFKDPSKAKWARIPSGAETCAFCMVMASRGAIYATEKSAGGGDEMNRYHRLCDCTATPFWKGDTYPEGYNPDELYTRYMKARAASGSAQLALGDNKISILSTLRQQEGIR